MQWITICIQFDREWVLFFEILRVALGGIIDFIALEQIHNSYY